MRGSDAPSSRRARHRAVLCGCTHEIVDAWKDLKAPDECGAFKQIYVYRHGLVHGRYFNKWTARQTPSTRRRWQTKLFRNVRAHSPLSPKVGPRGAWARANADRCEQARSCGSGRKPEARPMSIFRRDSGFDPSDWLKEGRSSR
ncbi:MAG: hypothetical protein IPG04_17075 [Polyangiaceae bacterium]|nr:hypothetical protein [Polyangiaceae bacterium]